MQRQNCPKFHWFLELSYFLRNNFHSLPPCQEHLFQVLPVVCMQFFSFLPCACSLFSSFSNSTCHPSEQRPSVQGTSCACRHEIRFKFSSAICSQLSVASTRDILSMAFNEFASVPVAYCWVGLCIVVWWTMYFFHSLNYSLKKEHKQLFPQFLLIFLKHLKQYCLL